MAKSTKKRSADNIHSRKKNTDKAKNPFEVHIYNEKMKVLGKKSKNNIGLPGISRGKAIDKRKKTLLQEYKLQNKLNVFTDRRIGERNNSLTPEERTMARYAAVRMKAHKRKSIFNLGEDEILTHKGQTLSEIEKFDDVHSDSDDLDDHETGKLDNRFVEEAHFGGGMLKKIGSDGSKTHKDLIEELIAESKKRKAEKQKIKVATQELTEKLDTEWKDLLPLVGKNQPKPEDNLQKQKVDDYDRVMRELKFEARGTVSDRLKSEEEIAKEQKDRLEQLEKERQERMKGNSEENSIKFTHKSADDLDVDFVYEDENEFVVSYNKDGTSQFKVDEKEESEQECDEQSSEEETESEDDLSDLKAESTDSENEGDNLAEGIKINEEVSKDKCQTKDIRKVETELPFTFALPESYEKLQSLLSAHSCDDQRIIIERMVISNHSSLAQGNKDKLSLLFAYILQYINDKASEANDEKSLTTCLNIFDRLMPPLFDLAQMYPDNCHKSLLQVIDEKFKEYWKKSKQYPGLENLLFLKMVNILFTTSDFRHQIVTPSLIFIEQMLIKCNLKTRKDVSYGLFLTSLVLEYTLLSKRFMPGCINFLGGLLSLAVPKLTIRIEKIPSLFKKVPFNLIISDSESEEMTDIVPKMEITDLIDEESTETFKLRVLFTVSKFINEFLDLLKHHTSSVEIFSAIYDFSKMIDVNKYPECIKTELEKFLISFETLKEKRELKYLVQEAKKPKSLRFFEPKIIEVYDGKRHKVQSKEKAERAKLIHKVKRERKGALREIRRDNAFLGRMKISNQIQRDKERQQKVKRIFMEASVQQSELNELDRKKKKK